MCNRKYCKVFFRTPFILLVLGIWVIDKPDWAWAGSRTRCYDTRRERRTAQKVRPMSDMTQCIINGYIWTFSNSGSCWHDSGKTKGYTYNTVHTNRSFDDIKFLNMLGWHKQQIKINKYYMNDSVYAKRAK